MKVFVTADIHGFYDVLMDKLNQAGFDFNNPEHYLAICGDVFDRGTQCIQLYEFLRSLGDRFIYIRGNHEDLLEKCIDEMASGHAPNYVHRSNGTLDTVAKFTNTTEYELVFDEGKRRSAVLSIQPVISWINNRSVDYAVIGDNILVHGWLPMSRDVNDFANATPEEWENARWENGMSCWLAGPQNRPDGYTVICGHIHSSWGWARITEDRKEYPRVDADLAKHFEPWIGDGIIALDACTAISNSCNMVILEFEDEEI